MLWDSDVDTCDLSELTNSAFVNFVRESVAAWLEWRAKKAEHLRLLVQKYHLLETELAEADEKLCEFCTQDEEELTDDVLTPDEQKLEDQVDELEDNVEELLESIQLIRCDPNLIPTCGFDLLGRPVMLSDLTLESKCMLLALWFRRDHRSLALFPEVVANELGHYEERYLQELLEGLDLTVPPARFKLCFDNQFQVIDLILAEALRTSRKVYPTPDAATEANKIPSKSRTPMSPDEIRGAAQRVIKERIDAEQPRFGSRRELAKAVGCSVNAKALKDLWNDLAKVGSVDPSSASKAVPFHDNIVDDALRDGEMERLVGEQNADMKSEGRIQRKRV
jgi:hypothetical protein